MDSRPSGPVGHHVAVTWECPKPVSLLLQTLKTSKSFCLLDYDEEEEEGTSRVRMALFTPDVTPVALYGPRPPPHQPWPGVLVGLGHWPGERGWEQAGTPVTGTRCWPEEGRPVPRPGPSWTWSRWRAADRAGAGGGSLGAGTGAGPGRGLGAGAGRGRGRASPLPRKGAGLF